MRVDRTCRKTASVKKSDFSTASNLRANKLCPRRLYHMPIPIHCEMKNPNNTTNTTLPAISSRFIVRLRFLGDYRTN